MQMFWRKIFSNIKPTDNYCQIQQIQHKNMTNPCVTYADKLFWNSSGGYKKSHQTDY